MFKYTIFIFSLCIALSACQSEPPPPLPQLGTAARPVTYEKFDDVASLFQQQSDTTYVINFWATWCKPCREELPLLNQLAQEEKDKKLKVILISLDTEPSAINRIPAFLAGAAPDLSSIILTDEDPAWGKTVDRVWTGSLPTTIIYQRDRKYVYRRGFNTYPDVRAALDPLLGS